MKEGKEVEQSQSRWNSWLERGDTVTHGKSASTAPSVGPENALTGQERPAKKVHSSHDKSQVHPEPIMATSFPGIPEDSLALHDYIRTVSLQSYIA